MSRIGAGAYGAGVIVAVIALGVALPMPAAAQAGSAERAAQTTAGSNPQGIRKPVNPADAAKKKSGPQPAVRDGNGEAWTIDRALPAGSKAVQPTPTTESAFSNLGRMQLEGGTFGVETQSQFKENKFSDGRQVPGLETEKRAGSSFFGLSLQVPTTNNTWVPAPIGPRRE
jgi:hypothetical protein